MLAPSPAPKTRTTIFAAFGCFFSVCGRLLINAIPLYNLNPSSGLGVFSGARLPLWQACIWPLLAYGASDIFLWLIRGRPAEYFAIAPWIYPSMIGYVVVGRFVNAGAGLGRMGLASALGSVQFFLLSNWGAWAMFPDNYLPGWAGLMDAYVRGLPFYEAGNPLGYFGLTLLGDLFFTSLFFGVHVAVVGASKPAVETTS